MPLPTILLPILILITPFPIQHQQNRQRTTTPHQLSRPTQSDIPPLLIMTTNRYLPCFLVHNHIATMIHPPPASALHPKIILHEHPSPPHQSMTKHYHPGSHAPRYSHAPTNRLRLAAASHQPSSLDPSQDPPHSHKTKHPPTLPIVPHRHYSITTTHATTTRRQHPVTVFLHPSSTSLRHDPPVPQTMTIHPPPRPGHLHQSSHAPMITVQPPT
jgi:hypothetical protein